MYDEFAHDEFLMDGGEDEVEETDLPEEDEESDDEDDELGGTFSDDEEEEGM